VPGPEGEAVAPLIRKVIRLSFVAGILVVAQHVAQYEVAKSEHWRQNGHSNTTSTLVINIMIGLMVPACGYYGAKNRNRSLLSCFYGLSLAQAMCGMLTVFVLASVVAGGNKAMVTDGRSHKGSGQGRGSGSGGAPPGYTQVPEVGLPDTGFAIVQVVLSCFQFIWGRQLLEAEYFAEVALPGNAPTMEMSSFAVQPAPAHPAYHGHPSTTGLPVGRVMTQGAPSSPVGGTVIATPYVGTVASHQPPPPPPAYTREDTSTDKDAQSRV